MRWRGVVVELRRTRRIEAAERATRARPCRYTAPPAGRARIVTPSMPTQRRAADIDDPHLPALQEEVHAVGLAEPVRQPDRAGERHDAAHHDPVDLAVGHGQLARPEHLRDEELAAQALGVERAGMRAGGWPGGLSIRRLSWTGSCGGGGRRAKLVALRSACRNASAHHAVRNGVSRAVTTTEVAIRAVAEGAIGTYCGASDAMTAGTVTAAPGGRAGRDAGGAIALRQAGCRPAPACCR